MRRLPLAALVAVCAAAPARAVDGVAPIPEIRAPMSAPPILAQLASDLALVAPPSLALPPSAVPLTGAAWSNMKALAAPAAASAAAAAAPAAASAAEEAPAAARAAAPASASAPDQVAARARLAVAGQVLGRFDPASFAALPEAQRDAALAEMWDGWKSRGLVAEPAAAARADAGPALDALILEGVDDKALTHSNKSIFLGVGVLGYPLADAVWLSRTRIRDALDDNTLRYPEGQRWRTSDGTPEFLGQSPQAQPLLDAWGAAATLATQIVRQAEAGSRELPRSAAASAAAAAAFADVAADLVRAGDREALGYLSGQDPTFSAFLLDARKPGYYLYNGDQGVVARILATPSAARLGLRRVEHPDPAIDHKSTYLYRPARVVERLREAARETADHADAERAGLAAYAGRVAPLAARLAPPAASPTAYEFVDPEFLPGSVLDSPANVLPARGASNERADMPFRLGMLRGRIASGQPHPFFSAARWAALELLLRQNPALAAEPDDRYVRFVAASFQTRGKVVARIADGSGALLQLSALDDLAKTAPNSPERARELRFLSTALEAGLR
jgi:hypothetical protein